MTTGGAQLVGWDALQNDIGRLAAKDGDLDTALRQTAQQLAAGPAATARSAVPITTGRMGGSITVATNQAGATVRMGGPSVPYAGFVDFGGRRQSPHLTERPYQATGRYFFPAFAGLASQVQAPYENTAQATFNRYGWTNPGTDPGGIHT